jgi:hypothetical protein
MTLVQPSGEMSAKIREELREPDADSVAKDLVAIREWLDKQPHLPKDMGMCVFVTKIRQSLRFSHLSQERTQTTEISVKFSEGRHLEIYLFPDIID